MSRKPVLVEFRCPWCGEKVCEAYEHARVFCPKCRKWFSRADMSGGDDS